MDAQSCAPGPSKTSGAFLSLPAVLWYLPVSLSFVAGEASGGYVFVAK